MWAVTVAALGCGGPAARPEVATVNVAAPVARPEPSSEPAAQEDDAPPKPRRPPKPEKAEAPRVEAGDQDDVTRARSLFQEGVAAYASADYALALSKFQEAYALKSVAPLLFNIATAELKLGQTSAACAHFRKYVADGDPADPRIQEVSKQVAQRCP